MQQRSLQFVEPERRPLLESHRNMSHQRDVEPVYSCQDRAAAVTSKTSQLKVYRNIQRIRRDIIAVVEDYLSLEQLRDVRINIQVVRPLVDQLYEPNDISIVYCLLVNRWQFLNEQAHLNNRQNVNYTRATLCELIATRILRRFNEDNAGEENLMVLAHVLIAGFKPFQNAPEEVVNQVRSQLSLNKTLPALEVAILSESRIFLSSTSCQKVVDAIYVGQIIYTPSSYMDVISDNYKQRPIQLYDPKTAYILNQYRLVVPRTRNFLEILHFVTLLVLYMWVMEFRRDPTQTSKLEIGFIIYSMGWVLDQFATILEHGWRVYTQNLWSFLDVTYAVIYWVYLVLRVVGWRMDSVTLAQQAMDVLAMGAPVLIPRLAFNLLSDNLVFLSLRSMMSSFALLTFMAAWCFGGFLLTLWWLGSGKYTLFVISKWMIYIWFGLDGSGIHYSTEFHQILGPAIMITFAFLGNTLFLTILVSVLSHAFSKLVEDSVAEIQFRRAVQTLEGVKGDAIFAYQPPFNLLAFFFLIPLKKVCNDRWFHKIHVQAVRILNSPILVGIYIYERFSSWSTTRNEKKNKPPASRRSSWFWEKWRWSITSHNDLETVFEVPCPDSLLDEIATHDPFTKHMIRRQFQRSGGLNEPADEQIGSGQGSKQGSSNRRDSIAPGTYMGLKAELRGVLSESDEVSSIQTRLDAVEGSMRRVEALLGRLLGDMEGVVGEGEGWLNGQGNGNGSFDGSRNGSGSSNGTGASSVAVTDEEEDEN